MKSPRSSLLLLATLVMPTSQLTGCALVSRGETLQVRYYTLDDRASEHAAGAKTELALRLGRVDASGGLGEQIAVRRGTHEISYREDQRWTERPAQFVRRELERALFSERGITRSYSGHTPQMEVELIELELALTDKQAQARVRLTAQIRDDRRSLCHDNFETQLPVEADPRADMEKSVAALSSALHRTVEQVASRAVECLAASAKEASASSSRNAPTARENREPEQPPSDDDSSPLANAER